MNKRKTLEVDLSIPFDDVFGVNSVFGPMNSSVKLTNQDEYSVIQLKIARLLLLFRMTQCQICELRCVKNIRACLMLIKVRKNGDLYIVKQKSFKTEYASVQGVVAAIYTCNLCAETLRKETFDLKYPRKDIPESLREFITVEGQALMKRQETLKRKGFIDSTKKPRLV